MKITLNEIIKNILTIAIAVSFFQNVGELFLIFSGLYIPNKSSAIAVTPIWVKISKDLVMMFLVSVALCFKLRMRMPFSLYDFGFGFSVLFAIACALAWGDGNIKFFAAGIRAFYPILIFPLLRGLIDSRVLESIARSLCFAVLLMLGLQIFELFKMPHWDGANVLGLNKRNPGYFLVINSAGFFLVVSWIYVYWHERAEWARKLFCFFLIPVSIMLTASGSGVLALVLISSFMLYFSLKQKIFVISLVPFILVAGLLMLGTLTQRENIYSSPADRISIFMRVADAAFFPNRFGEGTNAAVLLRGDSADGIIVDSTVNSLVYNLGIYGFLWFVAMVFWRLKRSKESMMLVVCVLIFALSTVIYEVYPMNMLVFVYFAYLTGGNANLKLGNQG